MVPIRKGDGTGLSVPGFAEVRTGDGRVLDSGPALPDSAVARWTFDDADTSGSTAIDVWGSNDGNISGATTGATGQYAEAYSFDGVGDIVTADVKSYAASDAFTVSLWINGPSSSSFTDPFDAQGSGGAGSDELLLQKADSDTARLLAYVSGNEVANISSSAVVGDGSWHHIVGVWDGPNQTVYLYVDGSEAANTTISTTDSFIQSSKWNVGAREGNSANYDGRIDDPRVYDEALSATQVSNLYGTGSISG